MGQNETQNFKKIIKVSVRETSYEKFYSKYKLSSFIIWSNIAKIPCIFFTFIKSVYTVYKKEIYMLLLIMCICKNTNWSIVRTSIYPCLLYTSRCV